MEAHHLDVVADFDDTALDATGDHGATALDAEHVFDRHQEGLVDGPYGFGDVAVDGVGQLEDRLARGALAVAAAVLEGLQGRAGDDGDVVAGELVLGEQLAHFHLDQLQELGIVHHVGLVEVDDDVGHAHLTGEQDVLTGLGHGPVGCRYHQDRPVHLGGTGDHVLDVVGVARAVDVGVVALLGLVFHVGRRDGDAALPLFRSVVDGIEAAELDIGVKVRKALGDSRRQSGLAVVDVTDRAHVDVRLGPCKLLLRH